MKTLTVQAPAKINLSLRVHSRRRDGLHRLRTVLAMIDLCDTLRFEPARSPGLLFTCSDATLPTGIDNLVVKAFVRLRSVIGDQVGLRIHLEKHIPIAAGLGGGSSDSAAALAGLRHYFALPVSDAELIEHGRALGADVPFFFTAPLCRGEGTGDDLTPLPAPEPIPLVVVFPEIAISTRWAYENFPDQPGSSCTYNKELLHALHKRDVAAIGAHLDNDLESVALPVHPRIREVKERLLALGAVGALMSGSGSAVFGLFASAQIAQQAEETLLEEKGWGAVFLSRTLTASPLTLLS
jgi:4-diphosphocytidyl-2-C-methyl-D-erythritol kinase